MASVGSLGSVLSADEFSSLNDSVRQKLEDHLQRNEHDANQLKIQLARLQTQSEQRCFELDAQLQQLQESSQREESTIQELTDGKAKLEVDLNACKEQCHLLESRVHSLEATSREVTREKDFLLHEKEELASLLSRRNDDLDRLTEELKVLTDQLVYANKEKSEAIIKMEELDSKQLALDYKEKRLDQERELMVRQQRLLQDELDSRTKEVMNIRREKTSIVLELRADVSEKIEELRIAQKTIGEMSSTIEQQEKHIKELNDRLKEFSETELKMSENNRNELRSQMRLCELYKSASEDAQAKADELSKATEELQRLLRDASVRYGDLETESNAHIDKLKQQLSQSTEIIEELKKELSRANTLLDSNKSRLLTDDSVEAMSPSAAAASRLLKSGMTLTQIYSQYVSVSEQLLIKEEENKRLNNYIDQILQEIEERAPTITRQREDYEKSVEMVANLTRQLDLAVEEAETEKEKALEAHRLLGQVQRASQRFEKQVADLSKQVCFLLRELEEARGNRIREAPPEEDDRVTSSEGSADAIISRHLVTFRDVEEMQQRNQMLIAALREVSEKQDSEEKTAIDAKTAKIQQALENALAEIEHHRDTRRRHEELMESVIQQRDMYRSLIQEAGLNESRSPSKFRDLVSSTPAQLRKSLDSEQLRRTKESQARLEEIEMNYQTLLREKKESEKALNEKVQSLQEALSDVRAQNVRLGTQVQYADEKEKLLQGNLDACKKQLKAVEEKNKIYACTVAKHEQSIALLRDEAMNAQQQLARAEVNVSMLQEEKQLLKDAEQRLLIERDALIGERRNQSLLHANLESIKLNLERGESETRMRLQNSIVTLEQQAELLRKKLDAEEQRYRETVKSYEERLEADRVQLKSADERANLAQTQLAALEERLAAAESRPGVASPLRARAQVTRLLSASTPGATATSADGELLADLKAQLAESQSASAGIREQLVLANQQVDQYRSIADSMEEQLKKNNEAGLLFKQETEERLRQLSEEREVIASQLQEAQEKLKTLEAKASELGQASTDQTEATSVRISRLEAEVSSLTEVIKRAEESAAKAHADLLEQAQQTKEAHEKYERELMQHAGDVEKLNTLREQAEQTHSRVASLEQTLARAEEELAKGRQSWDAQKAMLEQEAAEKARRCAELDKQLDITQQQLVTLSARMAAATHIQETPVKVSQDASHSEAMDKSLNLSVGEEELRSADQLLELVRFLRREKEIAISRFEVMEAESQRIKTQLEQVLRQLAESQAALHEERERSATSALTSEKHTEMMRRLETLNALTDSNRLLRDERSSLISRVEEMSTKVSSLEAELEPLRTAQRESLGRLEELTSENANLRTQAESWRKRASALQERAGRAAADDVKRLQMEKDHVQKLLEQTKEANAKTNTLFTETQRTNTQLVAVQQRLQEENRKLKEELQKLQTDASAADAKRNDDSAKASEQANQLRRIARKYKTQYEELKAEHDKLVQEHQKLAEERANVAPVVDAASSGAESAVTVAKEEAAASTLAAATNIEANAARLRELEERLAQVMAEAEQLRNDNQTLRTNDERTKSFLRQSRQKIAAATTLSKEKEALTAELAEAKAKIETLEQSSEELNVRAAALRSQLEGRLNRLERENAELTTCRQTLESELELSNQRATTLQRQLEISQQQQQQNVNITTQQQQSQQPGVAKAPSAALEKSAVENPPPTANIKPMASSGPSSVTGQLQRGATTSVSSGGPVPTGATHPVHRTTPTASIRPMAMTTRTTAAVQPTSVSVAPMVPPPLVAITTPTVAAIRPEENQPAVAGPSSGGLGSASGAPTGAGEERPSQKRSRDAEGSPSGATLNREKRTRLQQTTAEEEETGYEGDMADVADNPEEVEEYQESVSRHPSGGEELMEGGYEDDQHQQQHTTYEPRHTEEQLEEVDEGNEVVGDEGQEEEEEVAEPTEEGEGEGDDENAGDEDVESVEDEDGHGMVIADEDVGHGDGDHVLVVEEPEEEEEEQHPERDDMAEEHHTEAIGMTEPTDDETGEQQHQEGSLSEAAEVILVPELDPAQQQQQQQERVLDHEEEPVESDAFAPSANPVVVMPPASAAAGVVGTEAASSVARVPGREGRLPSFGRNTLAFVEEPGGADDGIVPSTPVLLRPRANDGFHQAVSSPAQATSTNATRFIFGNVPEMSSLPPTSSTGSGGNIPSHLESHGGMEDTRISLMDFSQLNDGSGGGRSVPSTPQEVSPLDELLPGTSQEGAPSSTVNPSEEQQTDFEGGPDMEGDAAAELDLLAELEEDPTAEAASQEVPLQAEQSNSGLDASTQEAAATSVGEPVLTSADPPAPTSREMPPSPFSVLSVPAVRPPVSRRGAGFVRGRALNRDMSTRPISAPASNSRPVPITWSPSPGSPQQVVHQPPYRENPARVFRRVPAGSPMQLGPGGAPSVVAPLVPELQGTLNTEHLGGSLGGTNVLQQSPARGRGVMRGRTRPRGGRRM